VLGLELEGLREGPLEVLLVAVFLEQRRLAVAYLVQVVRLLVLD
jgi:hypothetical protein